MRFHQRGRFRRDAVQNRGAGSFALEFAGRAFLFGLDRFPVAQNFRGIAGRSVGKDVRMTAHHFRVHLLNHVVDGKLAPLGRDAREEGNLEKQIAEFFTQIVRPPLARFFQRVEGFVGFFEQHWRQCRVSLFAIPWTTAGRAQTVHQIDQVIECFGHK